MVNSLALASLIVAVASFVIAFVVCITNLCRQYRDTEWQKDYREVELAQLYPNAQKAEARIKILAKLIKDKNIQIADLMLSDRTKAASKSAVQSQPEASSSPWAQREKPLDYADLFFLWKTETLNGTIKIEGKTLPEICEELDERRQEAEAFWDSATGQYESHQLLHTPKRPRLRKVFGLPVEGFLDMSGKWRGRGGRHTYLVQPLDIANWYSLDEEKAYGAHEGVQPPRYSLFPAKVPKEAAPPSLGGTKADRYLEAKAKFTGAQEHA